MTTQTPTQAVRTLMAGLIDYAGLFPPAQLDLQPSIENFTRDRMGDNEWMLGRFVCPATRLEELSKAAAPLMPGTFATSGYREHAHSEPWRITVIGNAPLDECIERMRTFNDKHSTEVEGLAVADAIEIKATDSDSLDETVETIPDEIMPFFEIPWDKDPRGLIAGLSGMAAGAKIRTGGVEPQMFPSCEQVAAFIAACAQADVPFKATAGLHHAVRGEYRLTYDLDAREGTMHGFLNVFVAAALLKGLRLDGERILPVLEERDASAFSFTGDSAGWKDLKVDLVSLARTRESFALSYGSCSFDEPVDELKSLGLI